MSVPRVLYLEDDAYLRRSLERKLRAFGADVRGVGTLGEALSALEIERVGLVLVDLELEGQFAGLDAARAARRMTRRPVIGVLSGHDSPSLRAEARAAGVDDYLAKHDDCLDSRLHLLVARSRGWGAELLGASAAITRVRADIELYADRDAPVLVQGETGVGKELVARALHEASHRRGRPFVSVNCAAFPETLFESELFGHARGAFSGAHARHEGLFASVADGTLFLDEIGELPLCVQAKLLRVLDDRTFRLVGETQPREFMGRLVAATNRDLDEEVRAGRFRRDLRYRLDVLSIEVPPLRERRMDVTLLAQCFALAGEPSARLTLDALGILECQAWPGNVRELRGAIERARIRALDGVIDLDVLRASAGKRCAVPSSDAAQRVHAIAEIALEDPPSAIDVLTAARREVVERAVARDGTVSGGARALGLHRNSAIRQLAKASAFGERPCSPSEKRDRVHPSEERDGSEPANAVGAKAGHRLPR